MSTGLNPVSAPLRGEEREGVLCKLKKTEQRSREEWVH